MLNLFRRKEKTQEGVRKTQQTWFGRLVALFQGGRWDESLWEEAEEILLGADVGAATAGRLLEQVRARARQEQARDPQRALALLKEEMLRILRVGSEVSLFPTNQEQASRPLVVLVVGVNGTGKTTSIAKMAHYLQEQGSHAVLGAADTFRAAAIAQLQVWGKRAGAEVVAHQPGADPGAVAFDAYQAARARGADVLLLDTAGRLHTKYNLMEELKKIKRVLTRLDPTAPHRVLLVMDATTGQNALPQARSFTEAVGCSGIFLAKLDGTAKGGVVLAIADQLKLPVLFIGTGEGLEDLAPFDPEEFVEALFAPAPGARR